MSQPRSLMQQCRRLRGCSRLQSGDQQHDACLRPQQRHVTPLRTLMLICLGMVCGASLSAQEISLHANYMSGSRIFIAPRSILAAERNGTNDFSASFSTSAAMRVAVSSTTALELALEYAPMESRFTDNHGTSFRDGYDVVAIEVAGLFTLPVSSRSIQMYVGGGTGFYAGTRSLAVAGVSARSIMQAPSFGILTLIGVRYAFHPSLAASFEWRFRNPQLAAENVYDQSSVTSNGVTYPLPTDPFFSRVNLNGNVFRLGLGWSF
jgi:hypothetical protein